MIAVKSSSERFKGYFFAVFRLQSLQRIEDQYSIGTLDIVGMFRRCKLTLAERFQRQ